MYRFVYSYTGDKQNTEDIVSEGYTKAFENIYKFKKRSSFKTWVFKIIKNEIFRYYRKNKGFVSFNNDFDEIIQDTTVNHTSSRSKLIKANRILKKLNKKYSDVLRLRYLNGCNIKECSEILGISKSYVKVLQNRALKKANKILKDCNEV